MKELLKCSKIDPNIIDSVSHKYIYDLAAKSNLFLVCLELERAFIRNNCDKYKCRRSIKKNFHDLHEFMVEIVIQHQLRSHFFRFHNDPRGPYESQSYKTLKLPFLPDHEDWKVITDESPNDSAEGWIYGQLNDSKNRPLALNYAGNVVISSGLLFKYIDNYRWRFFARVHNNLIKS